MRLTASDLRAVEALQKFIGGRGSLVMHRVTVALLLSGAIGLLSTGCAASAGVSATRQPAAAPAQSGLAVRSVSMAACDDCQGGGSAGSHGHAANCQMCQHTGQNCPDGTCNLPFVPVHRTFQNYSVPQDLSYPPDNLPPAQYQYPYYTLRGPTDFFQQ